MNRRLQFACAMLACAAMLPAIGHAQAKKDRQETKAQASRSGDTEIVACVASISRFFKEDGSVGIRAHFIGERTALSFYPDTMAYVGTVPSLTHAQAQRWEPVLDLLRDAARQRVKVELRIDNASKKVESVEVRYHVPC